MSSHAALYPVKSLLGRQIGHCGTLDPFATGLLIALSGPLTKLTSYFHQLPKRYRAEIRFGCATDTLDPEGRIVADGQPIPTRTRLQQEIIAMTGEQLQVPPQYSALSVGGQRAYARARAGLTTHLAARRIYVQAFTLCDYRPPDATVELTVSTGTYIRAIARDLAARCQTIGYLAALRRTDIGTINVTAGRALDEFRPQHLVAPEGIAAHNPYCQVFTIPERYRKRVAHGEPPDRIDCIQALRSVIAADQCALLLAPDGTLLAGCGYRRERFVYLFVASS